MQLVLTLQNDEGETVKSVVLTEDEQEELEETFSGIEADYSE